ncbi:MAG: non-homologous end-joining DNA ligase, partial [Acidimicrobiales bacterium]
MTDRFASLAKGPRRRLRPAPHPAWVAPMFATLTDRRFSDQGWLYERKLDGQRCLVFRHGPDVRLLSRRQHDLSATYPEVADAFAAQEADDLVVDGEVVAFHGGHTSFARLQQRMGNNDAARARRSPVAVVFYAFDLLHLDGHDTTGLPLRDRKGLLRRTLRSVGPLRYTPHRNGTGTAYFAVACARGWEGLIAKRADAPYIGRRSDAWLKYKCAAGQEMVVGGYTDLAGSRVGFGALLVGYYDGDDLVYAGKVGTGYTTAVLLDLRRRLGERAVERSPFTRGRVEERRPHWVHPELVAQVAFTEWTTDGKLRHPRFEGLREDKAPREVRREQPGGAATTQPGRSSAPRPTTR